MKNDFFSFWVVMFFIPLDIFVTTVDNGVPFERLYIDYFLFLIVMIF